jgi:cell wall-associated NlpC family hydrolase
MPRRRLVAAAVALLLATVAAAPAHGDSVSDKQRQAQQVANRIDQLGDEAASLGEAYNGAVLDLQRADGAVADAANRLKDLDARLASERAAAGQFALRLYMYADQTTGLAATLAGTSVDAGTAQRAGYAEVALGSSTSSSDELKALVQDMQREHAVLVQREAAKQKAADTVAARKKAAEAAQAQQRQQLVKVKGELATLVAQEQQRRQQQASQLAAAQLPTVSASLAAAAKNGPRAGQALGGAPLAPAPSAGAAIAVRAALSQLGVPYAFAAASPGHAFDCSGLTMWAWAQAGVSMAHYTVSQWNAFPKVSLQGLQPGDLIFSYGLGHVGIYIGNGMMVAAPRTGDVVKITPVFGIRPLDGAVRP